MADAIKQLYYSLLQGLSALKCSSK